MKEIHVCLKVDGTFQDVLTSKMYTFEELISQVQQGINAYLAGTDVELTVKDIRYLHNTTLE